MSGVRTSANDVDIDLGRLAAGLWRNAGRILFAALLLTALAWTVASMVAPQYRAQARILIDERESVFTQPEIARGGRDNSALDEENIQSQVELVASTELLRLVADTLKLSQSPEFNESLGMGTLSRVLVMAGLKADPAGMPLDERVLKTMRDKLTVYRVERSRIIVVEFASESPQLAADVANALAGAYIEAQRDAKKESEASATDYLGPEIEAMRARVREAEAKVAQFRGSSDLFLTGQSNTVLATQQLSELSTELSRVRASRIATEARAEGIRQALASGTAIDTNPEVLSSPLLQRLREREVQLNADIADLSTSLLPNHPRIKALQSQLAGLSGQIRDTARKVLAGIEGEAEIARLRERQLEADLNTLKAESARASEEEVELRALEREAAAERQLLESYETRFREAASRTESGYLPVNARITSRATPPAEPFFPKKAPIVGATFVGSLLVLALIVLMAELFSGRAMVAAPRAMADAEPDPLDADDVAAPAPAPEKVAQPLLVATPTDNSDRPRPSDELSIPTVARRLARTGAERAIVVSPEGDEASAAAAWLVRELASLGLRSVLVDLTGSDAAAGNLIDGEGRAGITDLLSAQASFPDVIHPDDASQAHVIPTGAADPARAMRAVGRLPMILDALSAAYDIVVVECGASGGAALKRLADERSEIVMSIVEPNDSVVAAATADLASNGLRDAILMSPVGYDPAPTPLRGRTAA